MTKLMHPCGAVDLSNGCTPLLGRCRLPACCSQSDARLSNVFHCLPKVTYSSDIMRFTLHSLHSPFPSPMANHCSVPFSMRRVPDISSLTPGIRFCETRRERFCRGSELESGIFHYAGLGCHPSGFGGCGGKYSRRACRSSALATTV